MAKGPRRRGRRRTMALARVALLLCLLVWGGWSELYEYGAGRARVCVCDVPSVAEVGVGEDKAGEGVEDVHAEWPVEEEEEFGGPEARVVGRLCLCMLRCA